jgi:hypothetical protein
LTQLYYINKSDANSSGPTAYPATALDSVYNSAPLQDPLPTPAVNPLPAKLSNNILNSVFNKDNILDTLVLDLVPNTDELELLICEVQY